MDILCQCDVVVETTAHRACGRTSSPHEKYDQCHPQQGEVMSLPSCIYQKLKLHTTKGVLTGGVMKTLIQCPPKNIVIKLQDGSLDTEDPSLWALGTEGCCLKPEMRCGLRNILLTP
ncbi:uncharacterized protein ACWYII_037676 isoform 2-T4 [Salvelinus alpinus]